MDFGDEHSEDISRSKRKRSPSSSTGKKCKFSGQNDKRLEHKDISKLVTSNANRGMSILCIDLVSDDDDPAPVNTSMDNNQVTNIKDKDEDSKNKSSQVESFENSKQQTEEVASQLELLIQKSQRYGDAYFIKQNVIEQPKDTGHIQSAICEEDVEDMHVEIFGLKEEKIADVKEMRTNAEYLDFDQEEFDIFDDWYSRNVEVEENMEIEQQNEETHAQEIDDEESESSFSSDPSIPDENIPPDENILPDPFQENQSSLGCVLHNLLEKIFENEMNHLCPIHHNSEKTDISSKLNRAKPRPIYNIISSKLQPPIYPPMDDKPKNSDISSEFQPSISTPMVDIPKNSDETTYRSRRVSNCFKKEKICAVNRKRCRLRDEIVSPKHMRINSSDSSGNILQENLLLHWSKIACSFEAESYAHLNQPIGIKSLEIVCSFNILSNYQIIVYYEEERRSISVYLPEVGEMEKRWLLEGKTDEQVKVQQDTDLKRLANLYLEIMLDPERKDTFHKLSSVLQTRLEISNNMDSFSDAAVLNTMGGHTKNLPSTERGDCKLATKIVEVDPESLLATIEQNTLLPLKLKLNAYMHLNEFIPTIVGLPYGTAKTKIVESYEYGYLYEKLQNYFIATRDCSFVHFPDSFDERNFTCNAFPDFEDEVESCPLYKTIEVPKTASNFVESLCTDKSYSITCYENEAKKYLSKATSLKKCTFEVLVKQLSSIRSSSVPESLRFIT